MLTIFNRKELIVTMDMNRQSDIRNILSANQINYSVKTTNLQNAQAVGSRRGRVGSFGVDSQFSYEYKIYVHKQDYERAKHLIGR